MEKIISVLNHLSVQTVKGIAMCTTAKAIYQAYEENRIKSNYYFLGTTYLAAIESALMAFARITIPNDDSITFDFLFNIILQKVRNFPYANKEKILSTVKLHKSQCSVLEPLILKVKDQRDNALAHLDRLYVNNPAKAHAIEIIDMREIEDAFYVLLQMLKTYKMFAENTELTIVGFKDGIFDDVDYLFQLIEKADQS